jgi:HMG (high mobility group) box
MDNREQHMDTPSSSPWFAEELDLQGLADAIPIDSALIIAAYEDDGFWMPPRTDGLETAIDDYRASTNPSVASLMPQGMHRLGGTSRINGPPPKTRPWAFSTAQSGQKDTRRASHSNLEPIRPSLVSPMQQCRMQQHASCNISLRTSPSPPNPRVPRVGSPSPYDWSADEMQDGSNRPQDPGLPQSPASFSTVEQLFRANPAAGLEDSSSTIHSSESSSVSTATPKKRGRSGASIARPLTAYNFFFRFERERLLGYCEDHTCNIDAVLDDGDLPEEYNTHFQLTLENSAEFQAKLLRQQWNRDRSVKRKHCKSHGRISFHSLSKRIAQSWNKLPDTVKQVFHNIAAQDTERYKREMDVYRH